MYEMLIGFPPFCSEGPQETYKKIMNWRETLVFPLKYPFREARGAIERFCCEAEKRLEASTGGEIKGEEWTGTHSGKGRLLSCSCEGIGDTSNFDEFPDTDLRIPGQGRNEPKR
ncbi:Serine/threonine-protein kinase 38 [Orchesella cincta]|uniref:Serine/threonine-protein kinase 38 n=1 Tax=Orchesella cincta TaxID=48709 RepID=A0A1D2MD41_ORCCI|nr:Serine/threonine-protein kinase 38 [Orchesella cincta]